MIKNYKRIKVRGKYRDISYLAFYIHGDIQDYVYDKIIADLEIPTSLAGALLIAESNLNDDDKKFTQIWNNRPSGGILQIQINMNSDGIGYTKKLLNIRVKMEISQLLSILK